jgi:hypothetical protein
MAKKKLKFSHQLLIENGRTRIKRLSPLSIPGYLKTAAQATSEAEDALTKALSGHFQRSLDDASNRLMDAEWTPQPANAGVQSALLASQICDVAAWLVDLNRTALPELAAIFMGGAATEMELFRQVLEDRRKTTAEDLAEELNIEMPPGFAFGTPADWMIEAARRAIAEVLEQEYWQEIPRTTREDIRVVIQHAVENGESTDSVARSIVGMTAQNGVAYNWVRAMRVARTEIGNALNAGHVAGMQEIQDETGITMTKVWLSVLGSTTRNTHAALDGIEVGLNDNFILGGHPTPYPSHWGLPAAERINCQCTTVSGFAENGMDGVDDEQVEEAEAPKWDSSTVEEIANNHPELDVIHKKFTSIDNSKQEAKLAEQLLRRTAYMDLEAEYKEARLQEGRVLTAEELEAARVQMREIKARQDAIVKKMAEVAKEVEAARKEQRKQAIEWMSVPPEQQKPLHIQRGTSEFTRRSGKRESTGNYDDSWNRKMKQATTFLKKLVNASDITEDRLSVRGHVLEPQDRAFQRGVFLSDRHLPADERSVRSGVFLPSDEATRVFVHELGHHLEDAIPGVQLRANQFLDYRIAKAGTKNVPMNNYGGGYEVDEIGNEDDFEKTFNTKRQAAYAGKRYPGGSTEIISKAVELLYKDPIGFANRDPEYFKFIIGVLNGTIR